MNENKYALESGNETSLSSGGEVATTKKVGMKKILGMQRSHFFFYLSIVAFPVVQFLVFFVYMNLNSFILAFQRYDYDAGKYVANGWQNFRQIFSVENSLLRMVK